MTKKQPIRPLTCSCCGSTTSGRQWWNRDAGYGLCEQCEQWILTRESPEYVHDCYGVRGVHYALADA